MLGHIGGSTAVLTAQRQTLQHAQHDQDDGRSHANAGIGWQDAHDERGQTHEQNRHQKGVFAPDHVPQAAKHQCTEWAHDEARRKGQQRKDKGGA